MQKKKILGLILAAVLCFASVIPVGALKNSSVSVSLNKPTTVDSVYSNLEIYLGSKAVDGDNTTYWASGFSGRNPSIVVDLQAAYKIDQISIELRRDMDQPETRRKFSVQLSKDSTFSEVLEVYTQGDTSLAYKETLNITVNSDEAYQYVRIQKNDSNSLNVSEISVYPKQEAKADYSGTENAKQKKLASYLGIIDDKFLAEGFITRGELIHRMHKFACSTPAAYTDGVKPYNDVESDHPYYQDIRLAKNLGWIPAEELFRPNDIANSAFLYEILLEAMELSEMEQRIDVYKICRDYDLIAMEYSDKTMVTGNDLVEVLYNAFQAEVPKKLYQNDTVTYQKSGQTYLYDKHGLTEGEGVVTANCVSTLSDPADGSGATIEIDKKIYQHQVEGIQSMLGYKLDFFVDKDNVIVCAEQSEDNVVHKIDSKDVVSTQKEFQANAIKVETEGKKENFKLEQGYSILYNGEAFYDISVDDIKAANTSLTLIDNDDDGAAEVLSIETYRSYMIKSVTSDTESLKIYTESGEGIDFTFATNKLVSICDAAGVEYPAEALEVGDIIEVYMSKNKNVLSIVAGQDIIKGTVTGIETVGNMQYLEIAGETYGVDQAYKDILKNLSSYAAELKPGLVGAFYLNSKGNVVAVNTAGFVDYQYAFLIASEIDGTIDKTLRIKYMDLGGNIKIADCPKRMIVNQKVYRDSIDALPKLTCGMIKIRTLDGTPVEIDTKEVESANGENIYNSLSETVVASHVSYNSYLNVLFQNNYKMEAVADSAAPYFIIPVDENGNVLTTGYDKEFKVSKLGNYLSHGGSPKINAYYDIDRKTKTPKVYVRYQQFRAGETGSGAEVREDDPVMLVKSVNEVVNKEGETVFMIRGYRGSKAVEYEVDTGISYTDANGTVFRATDLACGDVIHYAESGDTLTGFKLIYNIARDKDLMESKEGYAPWYTVGAYTYNQIQAATRAFYSILLDVNGTLASFTDRIPTGSNEADVYYRTELYSVKNVPIYVCRNGKIVEETAGYLPSAIHYVSPNTRTMVVTEAAIVQFVVVYEF